MACSDAADACYVFGGLVASTGRGLGKCFEGAQMQFDSSAMQSRSCNMFFLGGASAAGVLGQDKSNGFYKYELQAGSWYVLVRSGGRRPLLQRESWGSLGQDSAVRGIEVQESSAQHGRPGGGVSARRVSQIHECLLST